MSEPHIYMLRIYRICFIACAATKIQTLLHLELEITELAQLLTPVLFTYEKMSLAKWKEGGEKEKNVSGKQGCWQVSNKG